MTAKKKVCIFYASLISASVIALLVFNLNFYAQFVLMSLAMLCVAILFSIWMAAGAPEDLFSEKEGKDDPDDNENIQ